MPTALHNDLVQEPLASALESLKLKVAASRDSSRSVLEQLSLQEKVFLLSGSSFVRTSGAPRLGLHPAKTSDGPTDIRGDGVFNAPASIVIPNATGLASTWNTALVERIGAVLAEEAKWKEVDILLAPTLNLHRDPRGGRNQESYGEDAFLAGESGAAFAKGVQSTGLAVCAKHLVCNDSETNRRTYDVSVDDKTLREVYLRPFEIMVDKANPASIMTSYNLINGESASHNSAIMNIVRDEWKWDGMFMSDWFGTYDGVKSVKAGLDLEMPFPAARGSRLLSAIADGTLNEADVDARCLKVIDFLQKTKPLSSTARQADRPSPKHTQDISLNRTVASEGIILMRNNGILPLDPSAASSIAVIGSLATDRVLTHLICPSYLVTPLQGIDTVLKQHGNRARHAHGPYTHKDVPKLDKRFTPEIAFHKWNPLDRVAGKQPVHTDIYAEALEAMFMRKVPGLDDKYEIEMKAKVTVPTSGRYILSVIAASDAEVFADGNSIFKYSPETVVDIQKFLFHSHEIAKTFTHTFVEGREYDLSVVVQSQSQSGSEPVAQGMIFGMVIDRSKEELLEEAVALAKDVDTVVLCVGTTSEWEMEGVDRNDIQLPADQVETIQAILRANPRTVVVNQSGAAVDLGAAANAAAVVHAHFAGQESGNAIADVLFGEVNPSGRTSYTWPKTIEDCPTYNNFPCTSDLSLAYAEGCAMGYRGYMKNAIEPAFCFGHGLSYTTFEWSSARLTGDMDRGTSSQLTISMSVTNTGEEAGKDVVQLYVVKAGDSRWQKTLEGYAKTETLNSGQQTIVDLTLSARSLASWDTIGKQWKVSAGEYELYVSRSVLDIVEVISYTVKKDIVL